MPVPDEDYAAGSITALFVMTLQFDVTE